MWKNFLFWNFADGFFIACRTILNSYEIKINFMEVICQNCNSEQFLFIRHPETFTRGKLPLQKL
jgi:hypothetical protein